MQFFHGRSFVCLFLLLILSFTCCKKNDVPEGKVITINDENYGEFSLEIKKVIPLETDSVSLLGSVITKVDYYNDQFYVHEFIDRNLMSFDKNGKFIFKLKKGKGPGEITYIQSFTHNKDTLVVNLYSSLSYYDLQGNYYYNKKLDEGLNFRELIYFDDYILTYGFNPSREVFQSFSGTKDGMNQKFIDFYKDNMIIYKKYDCSFDQEIATYFPARGDYDGTTLHPFSKYNDHLLLLEPPTNNIYYYDGENVKIAYTIDFGEHNLEEKDYQVGIRELHSKLIEDNKWGLIYSINETKDYISFGFGRIQDEYIYTECIFSKKSGKYFFLNDLFEDLSLDGIQIVGTNNNQFICMLRPYDISDDGRVYLTNEYSLSEPITENSNPVILFVTVKEK